MNPPAKQSPAPVGSITSSSGNAGSAKKPSSVSIAAPYSPCLATTTLGPHSWTWRAARIRFGSRVSCRSSESLSITQSTSPIVSISESRARLDPQVHRVERGEPRRGALLRGPRAGDRAGCWPGTGPRRRARPRTASARTRRTRSAACRAWSRSFRSQPYSPRQKKVLPPSTRSMSCVSTPARLEHLVLRPRRSRRRPARRREPRRRTRPPARSARPSRRASARGCRTASSPRRTRSIRPLSRT